MELSPNQEKIVNTLRDNRDGLGFNALKRATGLHTKVLNDNLKKLVPEVVAKNKEGVERWQRTTYKLTIDSNLMGILDASLTSIEMFEKQFDMKKMSMREQNACFPFIIHGIGNHFAEVLLAAVLLGPTGDTLFQTYHQKFLEHIRHFRENYLMASRKYSGKEVDEVWEDYMKLLSSSSILHVHKL